MSDFSVKPWVKGGPSFGTRGRQTSAAGTYKVVDDGGEWVATLQPEGEGYMKKRTWVLVTEDGARGVQGQRTLHYFYEGLNEAKAFIHSLEGERFINERIEEILAKQRGRTQGKSSPEIFWNSLQGKRWVERVEGGRAFIRTEGSPLAHILPESEIEQEIRIDESHMRRRESASVEAEAQAIKLAEKRGLHGFTASIPSVKARKIEETLDRQQGFSGRLMPRRVFIEQAVESGAVVVPSHSGRRLEFPNGHFFEERDVTKIALDYADYLVRKGSTP